MRCSSLISLLEADWTSEICSAVRSYLESVLLLRAMLADGNASSRRQDERTQTRKGQKRTKKRRAAHKREMSRLAAWAGVEYQVRAPKQPALSCLAVYQRQGSQGCLERGNEGKGARSARATARLGDAASSAPLPQTHRPPNLNYPHRESLRAHTVGLGDWLVRRL